MRIALVSPPWVPVPPTVYGGTEAVIDRLARGLVAEGHEVLLYATGDSTCPVPRRWTYDQALGTTGSPLFELRHVEDAYASAFGFDLVHDHTFLGPQTAVHVDQPVVATIHAPFTPRTAAHYAALSHRVALIAISHHHEMAGRKEGECS